MSRMSEALSLRETIAIPEELERAWSWMEEQGWGVSNEHGYFLTPYAGDDRLGIVFAATASLEGFFDPDSTAAARLAPIAQLSGDGSTGALWADDSGRIRFAALDADGTAYLLADSTIDFLRLIGVGHRELTEMYVGDEPDEPEAVAAVADFRAWVESTFAVQVPGEWEQLDPEDEFGDWVRAQRGESPTAVRPAPDGIPTHAISGDVVTILEALGEPEGFDRIAGLLGLVNPSNKALRGSGIEIKRSRGKVVTVWVTVASGKGPAYPHPERLITGITADADVETVIAVLGTPEWQGAVGVRYVIGGRYLHFEITESGIEQLTFMTDAP